MVIWCSFSGRSAEYDLFKDAPYQIH